MIAYKITALAPRSKGSRAYLAPTKLLLGPEEIYRKALYAMVAGLAAETRQYIIPAYVADLQQRKILGDAADSSWFFRLNDTVKRLGQVVTATVSRVLDLEGKRHTKEFRETARKALGINLNAVVQDGDTANTIQAALARNISLIRSLGDDTVKRIEQTIINESLAGSSADQLRSKLVNDFGVANTRARIIARDQVAKFHSDLDMMRQKQAGVSEYAWTTSHDERVRPLHQRLDGNVYKWGEATGAEGGLPPGKPILCRCRAKALLKW